MFANPTADDHPQTFLEVKMEYRLAANTQLKNVYLAWFDVGQCALPAGQKLRIRLNNDASANVTGATFTYYDVDGSEIGSQTINLTDNGITQSQLSPIVGYELNIVGPGNSESATFSKGAGTILYQSHGKITPSASKPADAEANLITAETANTNYSKLSGTAGDYFIQHFNVGAGAAPKSFHIGKPRFRPPLRIPPKEQRSRKT